MRRRATVTRTSEVSSVGGRDGDFVHRTGRGDEFADEGVLIAELESLRIFGSAIYTCRTYLLIAFG